MFLRILWGVIFVLGVSGCATMKQNSASDTQMRVSELERQLDEKDSQIADLKNEVQNLSEEVRNRSAIGSKGGAIVTTSHEGTIRVNATGEQVQTALKSAGFYSGPIDGKIGDKTKKAITSFQKAHNLYPDGVLGKKTWSELKSYLD